MLTFALLTKLVDGEFAWGSYFVAFMLLQVTSTSRLTAAIPMENPCCGCELM